MKIFESLFFIIFISMNLTLIKIEGNLYGYLQSKYNIGNNILTHGLTVEKIYVNDDET